MFKKTVLAMALIALPFIGASAQSYKFGHINANEIVASMPEYIKAEAEMKDMAKKYDDEYKRVQEELNRKYQEFQASVDTLPKAIAQRRQKEIEDMAAKQQQYQQDAQQSMQDAQQKKLEPILAKLDAAIKAVGQAEGVIYIFDVSRTPLAYINQSQSIDLTNKVKAKVGATATPAAARKK
jgi:outer membrane protein